MRPAAHFLFCLRLELERLRKIALGCNIADETQNVYVAPAISTVIQMTG